MLDRLVCYSLHLYYLPLLCVWTYRLKRLLWHGLCKQRRPSSRPITETPMFGLWWRRTFRPQRLGFAPVKSKVCGQRQRSCWRVRIDARRGKSGWDTGAGEKTCARCVRMNPAHKGLFKSKFHFWKKGCESEEETKQMKNVILKLWK